MRVLRGLKQRLENLVERYKDEYVVSGMLIGATAAFLGTTIGGLMFSYIPRDKIEVAVRVSVGYDKPIIKSYEYNKKIKDNFFEGFISNVYAQVPGLPINYWDSPVGCATCNANTGVFRDGLHFLDNETVELMMDCDGNGGKESNVNTGAFQYILSSGAYDLVVEEETPVTCGYSTTNPARQRGDARIDGLLACPRNLGFATSESTAPGASIQQRLDTYTSNLRWNGPNILLWWVNSPEAFYFDVIRGNVEDLKDSFPLGLAGTTATQLECNWNLTSIPNLNETPLPGKAFFYLVKPENSFESGNYGMDSKCVARLNPGNDCLDYTNLY